MKQKLLAAALLAFVSVAHAKDPAMGKFQFSTGFQNGFTDMSSVRNLSVETVPDPVHQPHIYEGVVEFDFGLSDKAKFVKNGDMLCGVSQTLSNETWCFPYKAKRGKLTKAMLIKTRYCEGDWRTDGSSEYSVAPCQTEVLRATVNRTSK